ncbi:THAP domain-containing protein 3 [Trichonephila clavata]|uniref:THAP domain-containing protein 3 n=1 Tax=Trichonephila clavata TaxID=2740835 RepID=A0A8X6FJR3_TRICU|nr:THAP domain-containing protein 3 [Trichonephila clavata]
MSPRCVARGCNNGKGERNCLSVSYFKFPLRNPILLKIWLRKINRKYFKPTVRSRLCSDHFEQNCFGYSSTNRRILKHNSIPTKFLNWEQRPFRRVSKTCLEPSDSRPCLVPSDLDPCLVPSDLSPCLVPSDLTLVWYHQI